MLVCMEEGRHCFSFESDKVQHTAALAFVQEKATQLGQKIANAKKQKAELEKRRVEEQKALRANALIRHGHAIYVQQQSDGLLVQDAAIPKNATCIKCTKKALPMELFYCCLGCTKALHKACAYKEVIGNSLERGNFSEGFVCSVDCYNVAGPGVDIVAQAAKAMQK